MPVARVTAKIDGQYADEVRPSAVAGLLPNADLVEPPWSDTGWNDTAIGHRFVNWPRLAPILNDWARKALA